MTKNSVQPLSLPLELRPTHFLRFLFYACATVGKAEYGMKNVQFLNPWIENNEIRNHHMTRWYTILKHMKERYKWDVAVPLGPLIKPINLHYDAFVDAFSVFYKREDGYWEEDHQTGGIKLLPQAMEELRAKFFETETKPGEDFPVQAPHVLTLNILARMCLNDRWILLFL